MIAFSTAKSDTAFRRTATNRAPAMSLADERLDVQAGLHLSIQFNLSRGEKLFAGSPERFASLAARADSGLALPRFALPSRIRARVAVKESQLSSENVIGILRGRDPVLRNEYVVMSAHMDHLGIGRSVNGDSIYNGAMDNAAGTALLMDMARHLSREHVTLRRSVIFAAVTAEEKGRLGSTYFANNPTVPLHAIVADLNTDMFLPIIPFTMAMVNGLEESDLAADARRAADAAGTRVVTDPEPEQNRFVRSDQYSFVLRGIPALSLKIGFVAGSPEQRTFHDFEAKRYHQPSDDVTQPVNFAAAAGFEKLMLALVREVANRDTRPVWSGESYFRKFAEERPPER
jgi:Zn-dependent M28 family amino/carboxypeptidase